MRVLPWRQSLCSNGILRFYIVNFVFLLLQVLVVFVNIKKLLAYRIDVEKIRKLDGYLATSDITFGGASFQQHICEI